ncbi:hypothetical protein H0H87_000895 [Tephrocybe sp. NHM501043]|nr:hypothetical protein H0H87_000895 [Tephrocybe sp. NHM501043]
MKFASVLAIAAISQTASAHAYRLLSYTKGHFPSILAKPLVTQLIGTAVALTGLRSLNGAPLSTASASHRLASPTLPPTIPENTPSGQYRVRAEQIALHVLPPEFYVGCAQINVVNGGTGNPTKISILGHISTSDPGINLDIYSQPHPASYNVPGPNVWRG